MPSRFAVPPTQFAVPHHFASIAKAVAFLRTTVRVPILLPAAMPPNVRLDERHPVDAGPLPDRRINAALYLRFGRHGVLVLQYGVTVFDGCGAGSARPVRVLGHPALLNAFRYGGRPWAEVIWPATPRHAQGHYGIAGTFTGPEILRLANSMRPATAVLRILRRNEGC